MRREGPPLGLWLTVFTTRFLDLSGGSEGLEAFWHLLVRTSPLSPAEKAAAAEVLGPDAIHWDEVRVAEGGILSLVFEVNGNRAFTLWHTVNLPASGGHERANVAILVHELTHVYQYERVGSAYVPQALWAQLTKGEGYGYGGASGLREGQAAGKAYADFNREQQAQIVQDYFELLHKYVEGEANLQQLAADRACYVPYIGQMRAGMI